MKRTVFLLGAVFLMLPALAGCHRECAHDYQSTITQAATCEQAGTETFTCTICGDSYTNSLPVMAHDFGEEAVELAPTCTEEGHCVATCKSCGQTKQTILEKLPHTLENATVTKEPTCTQMGEQTGACSVCGAADVTQEIPTNDAHQFENTVVREATCSDPGEGLDTCTLCGHTKKCEYAYKAHDFSQSQTVTAATCTQSGKQTVTCSQCGATEDRTLSATGHKWMGATCQQAGTCSVCKATGQKADHNYEILSEKGDGMHFARQVDKKCKTCGLEKTLYYAGKHEFDLEAIYKELEAYAKSYGLNVTDSFDDIPWYQQIQSVNATVLHSYQNIVGDSGPGDLIRRGKNMIDYEYSHVKNSIHPMSTYTIHLSVSYGQSASMGVGSFGLRVTLT